MYFQRNNNILRSCYFFSAMLFKIKKKKIKIVRFSIELYGIFTRLNVTGDVFHFSEHVQRVRNS